MKQTNNNNKHFVKYLQKLTFQTKKPFYKEFNFPFHTKGENMEKEVSTKYTQYTPISEKLKNVNIWNWLFLFFF